MHTTSAPSADLKQRILAAAQRTPSPTRRRWLLRHAVMLVSAVLAGALSLLALGGVVPGDRRPESVWFVAGAWTLITVLLAGLVLVRRRSAVSVGRASLWAVALLGPLGALAVVLGSEALWPGVASVQESRSELRCALLGMALGAGVWLALAAVNRQRVLVHTRLEAVGTGVLAASFGAVLITLRCTCSELSHMVVGHVFPLVVGGLLSLAVLERWSRWRRAIPLA